MLRVAHASRVVASASSRSRTFPRGLYRLLRSKSQQKCVSARHRNQHARRVRYPRSASSVTSAASVVLRDRVPVHHVPPSLKVIGAAVLILEIIGMLPHVDAEDRRVAIHQRTVLIWRRNNFELSILVFNQPRPAAAKTAHASSSKFLFEFIKAAER